MMMVTEPSGLAKSGVSQRANSPFTARAMASRMPWLISSDTCHQNVVQNGFPSTSDSLTPTASSATLLIFEHRALRVEQPDELDHRVEGDARDFLAVSLAGVGGADLRAPNDERTIGRPGRLVAHASRFFDRREVLSNYGAT